MSKEHLAIALALSVPVVVCITKVKPVVSLMYCSLIIHVQIDMTPPNKMAETIKQVVKILKSPGCRFVVSMNVRGSFRPFLQRKTPVFVRSMETAVEISTSFSER